MKLFDCTTFYDEELIIDLRLNMLNKYVHKFIICEANFSHSGRKKELNFEPKLSIENAVEDLCAAFESNLINESFTNDIYFNVQRLKNLKIK